MIPDTGVLSRAGICGLEFYLLKSQLRWADHVIRMPDSRIPKQLLYEQLKEGKRYQGGPKLRFKDSLKDNLKICSIDPHNFEKLATNRVTWRRCCNVSLKQFEDERISAAQVKRKCRKDNIQPPAHYTISSLVCPTCQLQCRSKTDLRPDFYLT